MAPLRNRYFALRHGESEANVAGIIVSDPTTGTAQYGLTPAGVAAVQHSATRFADEVLKSAGTSSDSRLPPIRIITSDFKRTQQTAQTFAATLRESLKGLEIDEAGLEPLSSKELRERYFGELEGGPNTGYSKVWMEDEVDSDSQPFGSESARAVQQRTASLIRSLETQAITAEEGGLQQQPIVIVVSHGDALQILQTTFQGLPAGQHRSLPHLNPAELRELVSSVDGAEFWSKSQ
mmetsp:Transcript_22183/g.33222  ORF Transcript_22183/g.33222 Transcript_22183/m.33222 type:complete len:236 (-) Transcript_22183:101-808(-)